MTSATPPTYWFSGINYNPKLFATSSGSYVTLTYADSTFLKSYGVVTSSASTTFLGQLIATNDATSVFSIGNTLATTATTTNATYYLTFVSSNQYQPFGQTFYTDATSGSKLSYNPATSTLSIGDASIGNALVNIYGTASTINLPTSTVLSVNMFGSGGMTINNGLTSANPVQVSYNTNPTFVAGNIGFQYGAFVGNFPATATAYTSGTITSITSTTALVTLPIGIYLMSAQLYFNQSGTTVGNTTSMRAGLSTSSTAFATYTAYNIQGYEYVNANSPTLSPFFLGYLEQPIVVTTSASNYFVYQLNFTGLTITTLGTNFNVIFTKIA